MKIKRSAIPNCAASIARFFEYAPDEEKPALLMYQLLQAARVLNNALAQFLEGRRNLLIAYGAETDDHGVFVTVDGHYVLGDRLTDYTSAYADWSDETLDIAVWPIPSDLLMGMAIPQSILMDLFWLFSPMQVTVHQEPVSLPAY